MNLKEIVTMRDTYLSYLWRGGLQLASKDLATVYRYRHLFGKSVLQDT